MCINLFGEFYLEDDKYEDEEMDNCFECFGCVF